MIISSMVEPESNEAARAPSGALLLRRGLDAALADPSSGRPDLRAALAAFTDIGDSRGRLVAAAGLLVAAWFHALDDPSLPAEADAIARAGRRIRDKPAR